MLDSDTHITEQGTISNLATWNETVVGGHAKIKGMLFSNFWTDMQPSGWYKRGFDTIDIYNGKKVGLWQVPCVGSLLLIRGDATERLASIFSKTSTHCVLGANMHALNEGLGFFADNREVYAQLIERDDNEEEEGNKPSESRLAYPELFEANRNIHIWAQRFVVPKFDQMTEIELEEVCPDVYVAVLFSQEFCDDVIAMANNFLVGNDREWKNKFNDTQTQVLGPRFSLVPKTELGAWSSNWDGTVRKLIGSLLKKYYEGTSLKKIKSAFISRTGIDDANQNPLTVLVEQDAKVTATIFLGDASMGGGGVLFPRYNCTINPREPGYFLIHPSRLTHRQVVLPVVEGTKFELVTLVA